MGRVQLQRQAYNALQRLDDLLHKGWLVHAGCAYVDVQNLRTCLRLADRLLKDVVHIAVTQRLLKTLFAGGVDALADHGNAVHIDAVNGGAND